MVQIEIIGNLGADVRTVNYNGSEFYSFNVCDNRKVNGVEVSQWFGCNINRKSEILQYLVKGQQVFVRGIPSFRVFDSAKNHQKQVAIDIFVNEIQLVGGSPKTEQPTDEESGQTDEAGHQGNQQPEPERDGNAEGNSQDKKAKAGNGRKS